MVLKGQTPFEIGLILIVLVFGMILISLIPLPILRHQLAVTTKITYTSNEASLTLLSLLQLKYDNVHTVYYALSTRDVNGLDSKVIEFIKTKLNQLSHASCFKLMNETDVILSNGDCKSFDYIGEGTIFKPYGKVEKIILEYNKVSK